VTVVLRDFDRPNGLCFSPDGGTLYIADSGKGQRVGRAHRTFNVRP
jgi:sugar lactone lactonase YvrE